MIVDDHDKFRFCYERRVDKRFRIEQNAVFRIGNPLLSSQDFFLGIQEKDDRGFLLASEEKTFGHFVQISAGLYRLEDSGRNAL